MAAGSQQRASILVRLRDQASNEARRIAQSLAILGTSALGLRGVIGVVRNLTSALVGMTRAVISDLPQIASEIASIGKQAERLGTSIRFMSGFQTATAGFGATAEDVTSALGDLQQRAANIPKDFQRWGVSTRDVNGQLVSAEELLKRVSDRLAETTNRTEQLAMVDELMGEPGRVLLPALEDGREAINRMIDDAERLGGTLNKTQVGIARGLRGAIAQASTAFDDLRTASLEALGRPVTRMIKVFAEELGNLTEFVRRNATEIGQNFVGALTALSEAFSWLLRNLDLILAGLAALQAAFAGLAFATGNIVGGFSGLLGVLATAGGSFAVASQDLEDFSGTLDRVNARLRVATGSMAKLAAFDLNETVKSLDVDVDRVKEDAMNVGTRSPSVRETMSLDRERLADLAWGEEESLKRRPIPDLSTQAGRDASAAREAATRNIPEPSVLLSDRLKKQNQDQLKTQEQYNKELRGVLATRVEFVEDLQDQLVAAFRDPAKIQAFEQVATGEGARELAETMRLVQKNTKEARESGDRLTRGLVRLYDEARKLNKEAEEAKEQSPVIDTSGVNPDPLRDSAQLINQITRAAQSARDRVNALQTALAGIGGSLPPVQTNFAANDEGIAAAQAQRDQLEQQAKAARAAAAAEIQLAREKAREIIEIQKGLSNEITREQEAEFQERLNRARRASEVQAEQAAEAVAAAQKAQSRLEQSDKVYAKTTQKAAQRSLNQAMSIAQSVGGAISGLFQNLASGTMSLGEAMIRVLQQVIQMVIQMAIKSVMANAAEAGAKASKSQAGIPIAGPALAVAALATVSGAVLGLLSMIPSAHTGFMSDQAEITRRMMQNMPGKSSGTEGLMRVKQGETIRTPGQERELQNALTAQGGGDTYIFETKTFFPPTGAEMREYQRDAKRIARGQAAAKSTKRRRS